MKQSIKMNSVLIVGITPYFLKRGNFWFKKNKKKILEAKKTQSFFEQNTVFAEKDQKYNFSQFLRKLDEMGYEKVYKVSEIGEFAQRGGIIDVFPINSETAFRFEFLGNKIENIEKLPIAVRDEKTSREILEKRLKSQKLFSDLKNLKKGDYLVHLDHGVSRFLGTEKFQITNNLNSKGITKSEASGYKEQINYKNQKPKYENQDYYVLEYAEGDKLYVPLGLERKLSRYIGFIIPKVSRLSSSLWQITKRRVREDIKKLAQELLKIYAKRETATKTPYLADDEIDFQLASSFKYEETPDQIEALKDIKGDLEGTKPMDRLLAGDVGFGKTEVALRAMVKTVKSGFQAVMLCPTTILANQHFQSFKQRLKNLPVKIALLSRFQSKKEQKEIIKKIEEGKIDILIGTHRILSKDVSFKNLGLLIIDDEHRFGVKQKEKLKKLRASLNILSLSATPIPRTLYLSLSSLRDVSLIKTPPPGRLAVKTIILPFSKKTIKKAIENEIQRKGQVYYLHNRIETIKTVEKLLKEILPKVNFDIAHGRLKKEEIIKVMENFQKGKTDVLIATTIIENGLDFPNVNTLIVDNATRLGLAEAHQIRGRVGRSHIKASAYFLYPKHLSEKAKIRLDALKEAEALGSGYRIALKDLEMRGAGNILGKEQSGNINRIGLNLYCQMLSEAVEKMKNQKPK
jgi:transcription-repair coupling factor (superfamily II helicase)